MKEAFHRMVPEVARIACLVGICLGCAGRTSSPDAWDPFGYVPYPSDLLPAMDCEDRYACPCHRFRNMVPIDDRECPPGFVCQCGCPNSHTCFCRPDTEPTHICCGDHWCADP